MRGRRRWLWLGLLLWLVVMRPEAAAAAGCFTTVNHCFQQTTYIDNFWPRFFSALDCELDLVECLRIKILGV